MNDDGSRGGFIRILRIFSGTIFQVETFGELEIELDGCALEGPPECISDGDIDLGSVKRTISGVDFPFAGVLSFEGFFELLHIAMKIERTIFEPTKNGRLTASAWSQVSIVPK